MANKPAKPDEGLNFRTTVPPGQLKKLIEKRNALIKQAKKSRVRYPDLSDPNTLDALAKSVTTIKKFGFQDHDLHDYLGIERLNAKGNKGKGKSKGNKGGGGRKLPDPNVVLGEVTNALNTARITPVNGTGDAITVHWNMENLDDTKARYFAASYKVIFECADFINLAEVSKKGVQELAKITGYLGFCSAENSRGQAVGFLVNPNRYTVIGTTQVWPEVANVQGIQDLRPGFMIEVEDKVTKVRTKRAVFHLKSMMGGAKTTQPVRYQQFQAIAKRVGTPVGGCKLLIGNYQLVQIFKNVVVGRGLSDHGVLFVTEKMPADTQVVNGMWLLAGDWNDFVDKSLHVTAPLTNAGFLLVYPSDNTSTQSMGGRLDGFFRDVSTGTCAVPQTGEFADNATVPAKVVQ
jgi:hypothetical protein